MSERRACQERSHHRTEHEAIARHHHNPSVIVLTEWHGAPVSCCADSCTESPTFMWSRSMHRLTAPVLALCAGISLTGCLATQSQLRHASDQQSAQLAQTNAALLSERAERAASDSALAAQLGMVRGDVQALRGDLATMRKEFGAK